MPYVSYIEGNIETMWEYIERDLQLNLGEEEHGAFIPATMSDVEPLMRYEILKRIHREIPGALSLQLMAQLAQEVGKVEEVLKLAREYLERNPHDRGAKSVIKALS